MQRILVADDGSAAAWRAVGLAAELAGKTGAELIALAVVNPAEFSRQDIHAYAEAEEVEGAEIEPLVALGTAHLARCGTAATERGVANFRAAYRLGGDPAFEIIDYARGNAVDLIVAGCRGRGRLTGLLLGSVSQKLVSLAPCSVLIAR